MSGSELSKRDFGCDWFFLGRKGLLSLLWFPLPNPKEELELNTFGNPLTGWVKGELVWLIGFEITLFWFWNGLIYELISGVVPFIGMLLFIVLSMFIPLSVFIIVLVVFEVKGLLIIEDDWTGCWVRLAKGLEGVGVVDEEKGLEICWDCIPNGFCTVWIGWICWTGWVLGTENTEGIACWGCCGTWKMPLDGATVDEVELIFVWKHLRKGLSAVKRFVVEEGCCVWGFGISVVIVCGGSVWFWVVLLVSVFVLISLKLKIELEVTVDVEVFWSGLIIVDVDRSFDFELSKGDTSLISFFSSSLGLLIVSLCSLIDSDIDSTKRFLFCFIIKTYSIISIL